MSKAGDSSVSTQNQKQPADQPERDLTLFGDDNGHNHNINSEQGSLSQAILAIYASSNDCADLVNKVNIDLENIRKWMMQNKLQIHPSKSKHMFIGSSYNLKNKVSSNPILINNKPIPRTNKYPCLGVNMD